jgi:hypothetical protein
MKTTDRVVVLAILFLLSSFIVERSESQGLNIEYKGLMDVCPVLESNARPHDLVVSGTTAFIATDCGFFTMEVRVSETEFYLSSPHLVSATPAFAVAVSGNRACEGSNLLPQSNGDSSLAFFDISNPMDPQPLGDYQLPPRYSAGRIVDVDTRNGIAAVAMELGTNFFFDVSSTGPPVLLGTFDGESLTRNESGNGGGIVLSGTAAYVVSGVRGGENYIVVLDLTNPHTPEWIGLYPSPSYVEDIRVEGQRLFLATRDKGLVIADISNPRYPRTVSSFDASSDGMGLSVSGSIAAMVTGGLIEVFDVSDPVNPVWAGALAPGRIADRPGLRRPYKVWLQGRNILYLDYDTSFNAAVYTGPLGNGGLNLKSDLNHNGKVDAEDLMMLEGEWMEGGR